ncbi:1346_t:CDS:2 [Entrophospora sp. SA101]|nr:1346_t:CDS:2 [Entrophospora sp. SA101]
MVIVAFISQKGGVGKSTLAQALASEAKKNKFNVLLADCDSQQATNAPARTSQGTLEIANHANLIIQPTGASRADLVPAVKEFHALKEAGIDKKKLLFVPVRLSNQTEAQVIQEYLKKTGYACSPFYVMEKASYKQIQNEGKTITEVKYKKLAQQTQDLEILGEATQEASQNLQAPETSPYDKRITGRIKPLSLKATPDFHRELKRMATDENCLMIEILEKALEAYKKSLLAETKNNISPKTQPKPTQPLNRFIKVNFNCDKCYRKFERDTVYSPAPNLDQLKNYPTYCTDCGENEPEFCSFHTETNQEPCPHFVFDKKKQLCRSHNKQVWKKFHEFTKDMSVSSTAACGGKEIMNETHLSSNLSEELQEQLAQLKTENKFLKNQLEEISQGGIKIIFSGKVNAQRIARKVKPRTLREISSLSIGNEEQKSKNLVIEGDNLLAMATLYQYHGKIDLIIADPPYNTGKDFHERELFRLGMMLDEIFGEKNRIAIINWQKLGGPKTYTHVSPATEYILVYAKDLERAETNLMPRTEDYLKQFKNSDKDPRGP